MPPTSPDTGFLRIEGVSKHYGSLHALEEINLQIGAGEIFALLGASGSGKSTLLGILAGLNQPDSGQVYLADTDLLSLPANRRPVNMMFQSYALFPHMTVEKNIAFGLQQEKESLTKEYIAERVSKMLDLVDMRDYAQRKPQQLSGGQQQRVALARSLAKSPKLLLLDEPMGSLDKKLRTKMQFELASIIEEAEVTCVMVTHDQEEAMTMAHRIAVMEGGKILQVGSSREVYEKPHNRYAAEFIGVANVLTGKLVREEDDQLTIDCGQVARNLMITCQRQGELAQTIELVIRPEHIEISSHEPKQSDNKVCGVIEDMAYYGSHYYYRVVLDSGYVFQVHRSNDELHKGENLTWEQRVWLRWSAEAIIIL